MRIIDNRILKLFLTFSAIMAEPQTDHEVELLKAVRKGSIDKAEALLSSKPLQLNDERYFDYHLILKALEIQQYKFANYLIAKGFRVYKRSKSSPEKTVLHAAVMSKLNTDLMKTLMEKGASLDIITPDKQNKTPIHCAIDKCELHNIDLFLSLFDAKAFDKKYLLHYAVGSLPYPRIKKFDLEIVSKLMVKGLSWKRKNKNGMTPFCIALKNKSFEILDILLSHYSVKNIDPASHDDLAPVYIASICGNVKVIQEYAESGFPINIPIKLSDNTWSCLQKYSGYTLLHLAVKYVKLEIVEFLLSTGEDFLAKSEKRSVPLQIAFRMKENGIWKTWQEFDNNNAVIDRLLQANTKLKSNSSDKNQLLYLYIACSRNDATVVEYFVKLGVPINRPLKTQSQLYAGYTPLHYAAKFRCDKTVEILLKNGANVEKRDSNNNTALHIAGKECCLEVVSLLLQYGANIVSINSSGQTPVHLAFENKNYEILDLLLSVPNAALTNPVNTDGLSHFHIACTRNNVNVVKSFIKSGVSLDTCAVVPAKKDYDPDIIYWDGFSPLHFAVSHNRSKIVQLLLQEGANVTIKDIEELTPLHLAYKCSYEMFGEFIKATLHNLNKRGKIAYEFKPLTDIIKVNENYFHGFTGSIGKINWSSNRNEHMKIINALLNSGSDINCLDNKGNAPIFYAYAVPTTINYLMKNKHSCTQNLWSQICNDLSREMCERRKLIFNNLLKLDINLDKCYRNKSILHYICKNYNYNHNKESEQQMLQLFLQNGADVNAKDNKMLTPLYCAIMEDSMSLINVLLDNNADVDCFDPTDNRTPLLYAIEALGRQTCYGTVKILVKNGANVNAKQFDGRTALQNVVLRDDGKSNHLMISMLVKSGADINSRDFDGFTALHLACQAKKVEIVKLLLTYGADINVKDNERRNAWYYIYRKYLKNSSIEEYNHLSSRVKNVTNVLLKHIIKTKVIGLPLSKKVSSPYSKFVSLFTEMKENMIAMFQVEVKSLQAAKVHDKCTLYDVIFKDENSMSRLVENPAFYKILKSGTLKKKFVNYGYLIELKFQAGVDRAKLLSEAKCLLSGLALLPLPHTCSENICKYFNNVELRESIEILRGIVDFKIDNAEDSRPLRSCRMVKRQKIK